MNQTTASTVHTKIQSAIINHIDPSKGHWIWAGPIRKTRPVLRYGSYVLDVRKSVVGHFIGKKIMAHSNVYSHCGEKYCVKPNHLTFKEDKVYAPSALV